MGGGYLYKQLNKDIKQINKVFISLFSVGIILIAIFVGVNITKNSYALFSDNVVSTNTIGIEVDTCNLYVPNKPILDSSMIPVYYDEPTGVWKKADSTNQNRNYKWYDYCEKKWANSVTVTSSSRSTYLNANPGTEIPMDDILTMQVWVPRYKYKVWNYNSDGTVTSNPQEIEIVFEEGTNSTGEITCIDNIQGEDGDGTSEICRLKSTNDTCTDSTCNNKYYTHPAFTFGEEELTGFWIGKFEISSNIECEASINSGLEEGCNLSNIMPLMKPNITSWRGGQVATYETNIMKMNDSGNQYGLSTTTDTHMIKNMEWGALAYLSYSKYGTCTDGKCQEIGMNSNSDYIIGCGPQSEGDYTYGEICNSYETKLGQSASTTGNIYGVYDMNGGAYEYVMGNLVSLNENQMLSGYDYDYNSGYSGIIYRNGTYISYTGEYNYPEEKYYNIYSFNDESTNIQKSKLGDSIKETFATNDRSWYNDYNNFINFNNMWFLRGGRMANGGGNGIFAANVTHGGGHVNNTSRVIIIPTFNY